jgi:hypothetical protein
MRQLNALLGRAREEHSFTVGSIEPGSLKVVRRALQIVLILYGCILAGRFGVTSLVLGPAWTIPGEAVTPFLDSEYKWFAAVFLGLGALCWSMVPRIETYFPQLLILMAFTFAGGLFRLVTVFSLGVPERPAVVANLIELLLPLISLPLLLRVRQQSNAATT